MGERQIHMCASLKVKFIPVSMTQCTVTCFQGPLNHTDFILTRAARGVGAVPGEGTPSRPFPARSYGWAMLCGLVTGLSPSSPGRWDSLMPRELSDRPCCWRTFHRAIQPQRKQERAHVSQAACLIICPPRPFLFGPRPSSAENHLPRQGTSPGPPRRRPLTEPCRSRKDTPPVKRGK